MSEGESTADGGHVPIEDLVAAWRVGARHLAEAHAHEMILERIWEFVHGNTDDISLGIGRIMKPLEVCAVCSKENDYSQDSYCACWSAITERDVEKLTEMGVEIDDQDEQENN